MSPFFSSNNQNPFHHLDARRNLENSECKSKRIIYICHQRNLCKLSMCKYICKKKEKKL